MGLQIRKRTKGKGGWLNFSYSEKNGVGASASVKISKNITHNFGGKRGSRTTINFGNGVKYVSTNPKSQKTKQSQTSHQSENGSAVMLGFFVMLGLAGAGFAWTYAVSIFGMTFGSLLCLVLVCLAGWRLWKEDNADV